MFAKGQRKMHPTRRWLKIRREGTRRAGVREAGEKKNEKQVEDTAVRGGGGWPFRGGQSAFKRPLDEEEANVG